LEAIFPKKYTPKKHVHTAHAHYATHTHTPKSQHYIHIVLDTLHTISMFTPHTPIMLLYMVEFIHALIVIEKVTWPKFTLVD